MNQYSIDQTFGRIKTRHYLIVVGLPGQVVSEVGQYKSQFFERFGYAEYVDSLAHISIARIVINEKYETQLIHNLTEALLSVEQFELKVSKFRVFINGPFKLLFLDVNQRPVANLHKVVNQKIVLSFPVIENYLKRMGHAHMTIAKIRDDQQFEQSWEYFKNIDYNRQFKVHQIKILAKDSPLLKWSLLANIPLAMAV